MYRVYIDMVHTLTKTHNNNTASNNNHDNIQSKLYRSIFYCVFS